MSGNGYEMKHSGHKVCDWDSSSKSDRSHQEASAASESSPNEHTSTQSGTSLSPTTLSVIYILTPLALGHNFILSLLHKKCYELMNSELNLFRYLYLFALLCCSASIHKFYYACSFTWTFSYSCIAP